MDKHFTLVKNPMVPIGLECSDCGAEYEKSEKMVLCEECGSPLNVRYHYDEVRRRWRRGDFKSRPYSVWRYLEFLPLRDEVNIISLGEGWTPIVKPERYGHSLGLEKLLLKLDYLNPTGSFKDRGSTVLVSKAKELGIGTIVEDSSGNAGSSIAAYCAKAGISSIIYVPSDAPEEKLLQIKIYGGRLIRILGAREKIEEATRKTSGKEKVYYGSHNSNPYFLEGVKTLAVEIAEQMDWRSIDHLVLPVGGGGLIVGVWRGFQDLLELGWIDRIPRLHCVQSEACMPIVLAYKRGLKYPEKFKDRDTIAEGVRIPKPPRGRQILRAIRESRGEAIAVSDEEILLHQVDLAQCEGVFAEPTSCVALAGLTKLYNIGKIKEDENVIVPITGFGLKSTRAIKNHNFLQANRNHKNLMDSFS